MAARAASALDKKAAALEGQAKAAIEKSELLAHRGLMTRPSICGRLRRRVQLVK